MPKLIDIPGVGEIEFPDDMDDASIAFEAERLSLEAQPSDTAQPASWSDLPGNLLPSAGRAIGGIANAALGALKLMDPRPTNTTRAAAGQAVASPVETATAVGGALKDRYGSGAAIKDTLVTDPVGALLDASTLATGAGGVLRGVGRAAGAPGILRAGKAASAVGAKLDPVARTGAYVTRKGGDISSTLSSKGRDLMQHVLKPTVELTRRNPGIDIPKAAVDTGLTLGRRGVRRYGETIDAIEEGMGEAINTSPATFTDKDLTRRLTESLKDADANSPILPEVQAGVEKVARDFRENPRINAPTTQTVMVPEASRILGPDGRPMETLKATTAPGPPKPVALSARQVQDYKTTLGRSLRDQFGKEFVPGQVEGRQALRAGMREALAAKVPEVSAANKQLGPMYAVQEAAERRLHTFGNTDPISHASKMDYLAGTISGVPLLGAAAGYAVRSPALMSRAAVAMDRTGKAVPAIGRGIQRTSHVTRPLMSGAVRQALLDAMTRSTETP